MKELYELFISPKSLFSWLLYAIVLLCSILTFGPMVAPAAFATPIPSPTPTATPTAFVRIASPAATPSAPPTYTPTPKPTIPGPKSVTLKFGQTVTFRYLPNSGTIWVTFQKYVRQGTGYRAEIVQDGRGGFSAYPQLVVMQFGYIDRLYASKRVPFEVRHLPFHGAFIFQADDVITFGLEYQSDEESKIWYDPAKVELAQ